MRTLFFLSIIGFVTLLACERESNNSPMLKEAIESLQGEWVIVDGRYYYNFGSENGISVDSTIEVTSELGSFIFRAETVDYDINFPHVSFSQSNADWTLEKKKVNMGFVRVDRYFLIIEDRLYSCHFGDETTNSERNATAIRLNLIVEDRTGEYEDYELELEKI